MESSDPTQGALHDDQAAVAKGTVLAWAKFTVPVHAVLPWVVWAIAAAVPQYLNLAFILLHLAGLFALVASYPHWRGRGDEMFALVLLNHAVTFVVGTLLMACGL